MIKGKRDGAALSEDQITWFLDAYVRGEVADEQAAALLMAVYHKGFSPDELAAWTQAMIDSGTRLDLSSIDRPTVDKHSTGGVGDKVSLVLAPMVAACGAAVPMLSGRGLGHTGGTLDKLESISGFRASLTSEEMLAVLKEAGCVISAAGPDLAPADRKLYALRDVTGTVESIPLIASSIMSKKIAEGTGALVLDVKVGSGAFMPGIDAARELAAIMVELGQSHGMDVSALLTDMDAPLGLAVGNALEVSESLDTLRGEGSPDLVEVTVALAQEMLALVGIEADAEATLHDGRALACFARMVRAQGGDPEAPLPVASRRKTITAGRDGYLLSLDARKIGLTAWRLGAGRARKEDPVSPGAGVMCKKKPGDPVRADEPVLELHADDDEHLSAGLTAVEAAFEVGPQPPPSRPLVRARIGT